MKKFLVCSLVLVMFLCVESVCFAMNSLKRSTYVNFENMSSEQNSPDDDSYDENQFQDTFLFSTPLSDDLYYKNQFNNTFPVSTLFDENCVYKTEESVSKPIAMRWESLAAFGYFTEENALTDHIRESSDLSEESFVSINCRSEDQIDSNSENSSNLEYQFTFQLNDSFDEEMGEHPFDWKRYSSPYIEELQ